MGTDSLVCVGGRADGRRVDVDRASAWVRVPKPLAARVASFYTQELPNVAQADYELYERATYTVDGFAFALLVPQLQRPETTMRLLVDAYGDRRSTVCGVRVDVSV